MAMDHQILDTLTGHAKSVYLVGDLHRSGAVTFLTRLEYEQYPPDTDANDSFTVFHTRYNTGLFYIIEIPATGYRAAEALARELNLKFVPGKPHRPGTDQFNLKCGDFTCFTLEYIDHVDQDPEALMAESPASLPGACQGGIPLDPC